MTGTWRYLAGVQDRTDKAPVQGVQQLLDGIAVQCLPDRAVRVEVSETDGLDGRVDATTLTRSQRFQCGDTPYILEVTRSLVWAGVRTAEEPASSCSLSLYDPHWDREMKVPRDANMARNWGDGLENLFSGKEPSLMARFSKFVSRVWEIQEVLEKALA